MALTIHYRIRRPLPTRDPSRVAEYNRATEEAHILLTAIFEEQERPVDEEYLIEDIVNSTRHEVMHHALRDCGLASWEEEHRAIDLADPALTDWASHA